MKLVQSLPKFIIPQLLKGYSLFMIPMLDQIVKALHGLVTTYHFVLGIFEAILLQAYGKVTHSVALQVRTFLFAKIYNKFSI